MDSLWEASIELPTKIFTEKQIQVLTSKMQKMMQSGQAKRDYFERGIGIIANWASHATILQLDHTLMITFLVNILNIEGGERLHLYAIYGL